LVRTTKNKISLGVITMDKKVIKKSFEVDNEQLEKDAIRLSYLRGIKFFIDDEERKIRKNIIRL